MRRFLPLLCLLAPCAVQAQRLDTVDKILVGSALIAQFGDWSTTIDGARRGSRELDPVASFFIGHNPSLSRIHLYTAAQTVVSAVIASRLPPTWRKVYLLALTLNWASATLGNRARGLRFSLRF